MVTLVGGSGADSFEGAVGNFGDVLFGMGGADTLRGGLSIDTISGGDGDDLIEGGRGFDRLSGGAGNDTFLYRSILDLADERIGDFGAGDRIDLSALGALTWLQDFGFAGGGNEIRYRTTTLDASTPATEIIIDTDGDGRSDASLFLAGLHRLDMVTPGIITLAEDLTRVGTGGADTLSGGVGRDVLRGLNGQDSLSGGAGNDRLVGGGGNDILNGGFGTDTMFGGEGADVFLFTALTHVGGDAIRDFDSADLIDLSALGAGFRYIADAGFTGQAGEMRFTFGSFQIDTDGDTVADRGITVTNAFTGFTIAALDETATGSRIFRVADNRFNTTSIASATAVTITGGAGFDTLAGGLAGDRLDGGGGADSLVGGAGADTLIGGSGNDRMEGGDGNDLLIGGFGGDTVVGGAGNDTIRVLDADDIGRNAGPPGTTGATESRFDTVLDFAIGDVLDLSALGALTLVDGTTFTETPGEVTASYFQRTVFVGGILVTVADITVRIDTNGDGFLDGGVSLIGVNGILVDGATPGHFLLEGPVVATGAAGADGLAGGRLGDTLSGLAGADTLTGFGGADSLDGGDDADLLLGGDGNDTLRGGAGNDTIAGDAGGDMIDLGTGDDTIRYAPGDFGTGIDTVNGFGFGDRLDFSSLAGLTWVGSDLTPGATPPPFSFGSAQEGGNLAIRFNTDGDNVTNGSVSLSGFFGALEETAPGSRILRAAAPLTINDGDLANTLVGGGAADTLSGAGGNDTLLGSGGADVLSGGNDNDLLNGGSGQDSLNGGAGANTLIGGAGNDTVNTGLGNDTVVFQTLDDIGSADFVTGFDIGDTIDLTAVMPGLTYIGEASFSGGASQMRLNWLGSSGALQIDLNGDTFSDRAINISAGMMGTLKPEFLSPGIFGFAGTTSRIGGGGADTLTGFNNADTLFGMGGDDTLIGRDGANHLDGGAGNDVLFGGLDADTMVGGAGNDTLVAGGGIDLMTGGLGADVFRIVAARLPDSTFSVFSLNATVTDFDSADRLDFTGTSGFSFVGSGAFTGLANQARLDFLTYGMMAPQVVRALLIDTDGNGFHDRYLALPGFTGDLVETSPGSRILAFAGSVAAVGTAGADTMSGGLLGDTLDGAAGNDTIIGLAGADSLVGRDGADRIFGDAGADTIIGGAGTDTLTGGADADIFVYSNGTTGLGAAADVITDFQAGMGEVLNLSAIDADSVLAGNQAFVFIGSAAFSALGQVRFAGGVLQANTTGTLAADMEILLTGVVSLTAADLVL